MVPAAPGNTSNSVRNFSDKIDRDWEWPGDRAVVRRRAGGGCFRAGQDPVSCAGARDKPLTGNAADVNRAAPRFLARSLHSPGTTGRSGPPGSRRRCGPWRSGDRTTRRARPGIHRRPERDQEGKLRARYGTSERVENRTAGPAPHLSRQILTSSLGICKPRVATGRAETPRGPCRRRRTSPTRGCSRTSASATPPRPGIAGRSRPGRSPPSSGPVALDVRRRQRHRVVYPTANVEPSPSGC
jgi:hypothetical protein